MFASPSRSTDRPLAQAELALLIDRALSIRQNPVHAAKNRRGRRVHRAGARGVPPQRAPARRRGPDGRALRAHLRPLAGARRRRPRARPGRERGPDHGPDPPDRADDRRRAGAGRLRRVPRQPAPPPCQAHRPDRQGPEGPATGRGPAGGLGGPASVRRSARRTLRAAVDGLRRARQQLEEDAAG